MAGRGPEERAGGCGKAVIGPRPGGDEPGFQAEGTVYDGAVEPLKGARRRNRHPKTASPVSGGEPGHPLCEADADPAALAPFPPTHPSDLLTVRARTDYGFVPADLAVPEEEVGRLMPDGRSAFPLPTTLAGMHCSSHGNATETVSPVCPRILGLPQHEAKGPFALRQSEIQAIPACGARPRMPPCPSA
ncbi:hypothetical protein [Streptomyces sp. ME18-1-4]|uniref:hypothetical protein n=1 Tax=Streptomyces sp. ME18-1-4 TaxID=3028685 RepID=UPI0029A3C94C|nr:hypothetical protein [Streptomyces sp. ME18-1-4]MDX3245490.1 hypothetical protein [Streptomyces sp. ME18-1-4]